MTVTDKGYFRGAGSVRYPGIFSESTRPEMKNPFLFPCKTNIWRRGAAPHLPIVNVFILKIAIKSNPLDYAVLTELRN